MSADDLNEDLDKDLDLDELVDLVEETETIKSDLYEDSVYGNLYDYLGD